MEKKRGQNQKGSMLYLFKIIAFFGSPFPVPIGVLGPGNGSNRPAFWQTACKAEKNTG
jgi:hypothetical protein